MIVNSAAKSFRRGLVTLSLVIAAGSTAFGQAQVSMLSNAEKTISDAASAKKYAFLFFYKEGGSVGAKLLGKDNTAQTQQLRGVFDTTMQKLGEKAVPVPVNIADPGEKTLVQQYDVTRAPLPLVLAIAPNGAVTRGFPGKFTEEELLTGVASPGLEKCLKVLQSRRLVLLCLQNAKTASNEAAMKGVNEFMADPKFGAATEIVKVDPADSAEAKLVSEFKIDPNTKQAVTLLLAPPGSLVATYTGATKKDDMVAKITASVSGCGTSCAPGACGPAK